MDELVFGLSLDEAKALRQGEYLNALHFANGKPLRDANGELSRYKVTSVKTWKRSPERVEIGVQRGLREFHKLNETNLSQLRKAGA